MKYIDEYRDNRLLETLTEALRKTVRQQLTFMEVCGGHTHSIQRFGIPEMIPGKIKLISGPGCPVCVTTADYIDQALVLSGNINTVVCTFGDLIRVPGSSSSLEYERSGGADVRIVTSALEALDTAIENPGKQVVFLAIGFETTAPGTAATIIKAYEAQIRNFSILSAHKLMPPAMEAVLANGSLIDGFICPGHVAAITGSSIFDFIPVKYGKACVVTGFEPADLLSSILMLVKQCQEDRPAVEIQYSRAVTTAGNKVAKSIMNQVFSVSDAGWRGFGMIKESGLILNGEFEFFDAKKRFMLTENDQPEPAGCICGEILRGLKNPGDCKLFGSTCTPEDPEGACMVSSEGACNAWYRYRKQWKTELS